MRSGTQCPSLGSPPAGPRPRARSLPCWTLEASVLDSEGGLLRGDTFILPPPLLDKPPTTQTTATSDVQLIKKKKKIAAVSTPRHSGFAKCRAQRFSHCPQDHTRAVGISTTLTVGSEANSRLQVLFPSRSGGKQTPTHMIFYTIAYNVIVKSCIIVDKKYPTTVIMVFDTKQN